jgi:uncharacterized protein
MEIEVFQRGVRLFNAGQFFEAHEVLEDVWRVAPEPERRFLQGLIQLAVAFHHRSTGNLVGAASLMQRAAGNLSAYSDHFGGIQLSGLLEAVRGWQRALKDATPPPPMPRIEFLEC